MEIMVSFPGGKKVDAHFEGFTVQTDQPTSNGGEGSAPDPFSYFLASLATCAGLHVVAFCVLPVDTNSEEVCVSTATPPGPQIPPLEDPAVPPGNFDPVATVVGAWVVTLKPTTHP